MNCDTTPPLRLTVSRERYELFRSSMVGGQITLIWPVAVAPSDLSDGRELMVRCAGRGDYLSFVIFGRTRRYSSMAEGYRSEFPDEDFSRDYFLDVEVIAFTSVRPPKSKL